jgi:hypothetical protein
LGGYNRATEVAPGRGSGLEFFELLIFFLLCYLNITGMFSFSFLKRKIMFSRLDFLCMFLLESYAFEISD